MLKYSEDQERVPAGESKGGQFSGDSGINHETMPAAVRTASARAKERGHDVFIVPPQVKGGKFVVQDHEPPKSDGPIVNYMIFHPDGTHQVEDTYKTSGPVTKEKTMRTFSKFIPFAKVDAARREVWGIVTAELPDKDNEVCDYSGSKPYYQAVIDEMGKATDGENFFPLRAMHQLVAVGKCVGFDFRDADKEVFMGFKVVDDDAWRKVEENVYTGFSHGGTVMDMKPDPDFEGCKRYIANPSEISLVDNPCLASAHFAFVKADGAVEMRKFGKIVIDTEPSLIGEIQKELESIKARIAELLPARPAPALPALAGDKAKHLKSIQAYLRKAVRTRVNRLTRTVPGGNVGVMLATVDMDLGRLAKGMATVSQLAMLINEFAYLLADVTMEEEREGGGSPLPALVAADVDRMLDTLLTMVEAEAEEIRENPIIGGSLRPRLVRFPVAISI